ncbi:adipocyte plasma membrane-associated protein [Aplysia californica]|uniref:Adipocyte plasma membrane-associated protein n=1 Tax=Aplysia californica TaxID=6500 RepID=A0ABM0ZYF1_APLCA|nr:adipocyte plasma membrane-associated protein [Aplysia californica]
MSGKDGVRQRRSGNSSPEQRSVGEEEAIKKASNGWIRAFFIAVVLALFIPIFIMLLLPCPIEPLEISGLTDRPELTGVLKPNNLLHLCEKLYQNHLEGPESIEIDGEHIYTGTADGWVKHIHKGEVQNLVRFGTPPCGGIMNENTCGRPLGMRMSKDGFLIVIDAYYGLYKVNVATGDYTLLVSAKTPVNGRPLKFVNDLDFGHDGKIYFTDTSSRWHRNQFMNVVFEGSATGRLLVYDPVTGDVKQLMDGFLFANGVQLTKDKKSVLVSDTMAGRIYRYILQSGDTVVWADNLPGLPDNIRYCLTSGTYWVGFAGVRQAGKFSIVDSLASHPWIRGILAKVVTVSNFPTVAKHLSSTDTKAITLEMSEDGKILRSLQDSTGAALHGASQVSCADGALYFGSFHSTYLSRLYKKKIPGF